MIVKSRGKQQEKIDRLCEGEERGLYLILPATKKKCEVGKRNRGGYEMPILKSEKGLQITIC